MAEDGRGGPLLLALGVGAAMAGYLADRRRRRRWAANPDPLKGRVPRFPEGRPVTVETDDGASINTVTSGRGPRVLLVHGLTGNMDDLGPIAEHLVAAGFSVTGIDQRGHGGSTVGADGFGPSRQARDLLIVLDRLEISGGVLAGHSMGGISILQLALDHRETVTRRIDGLALIAAPTSLRARWRDAIAELSRLPRPDLLTRDRRRLRSAAAFVFGRRPSAFMLDRAVDSYLRCDSATQRDATLGLRGYGVADRLGDLSLPILVILGQADRLVPRRNALAAAHKVPDARAVELPDAGHMVIWERHEEVGAEIVEFARSIGSGPPPDGNPAGRGGREPVPGTDLSS